MISYGVEALYTSLPIDSVLKIVRQKPKKDDTLSKRTTLDVDDIVQLLKYCLTSTYFTFRDGFCHLTDSVAMDSPISSVAANLLMEAFEEKALRTAAEEGIEPRFWKRYVDDVFSLIKKDRAEKFLVHLNSQDENIRFTYEKEEDHRVPYLDVQVERKRKKLMTGVFCKKTYTNRVLAFDSHHSNNAKRAVIISLFDRVKSHFGKDDRHGQEKERKYLYAWFKKNGYPRSFVQRALYRIAKQIERNERKERARKRRRKNPKTRLFYHTLKVSANKSKEC